MEDEEYVIACPKPMRAASLRTASEREERGTNEQRAQSAKGTSRFTPTFSSYKVKRPPSPFRAGHRGGPILRKKKPINWKRVMLISGLCALLALVIMLIVLIVPKAPHLSLKRVSVPSSSSYTIAGQGSVIIVEGSGIVNGRLHNPNLMLTLRLTELQLQVFWVGYHTHDSDFFETGSLIADNVQKSMTLYPRDTIDFKIRTTFNHTGAYNSDPIWIDFIRRCLNQDEDSRRLRLIFRVSGVVGGWWGQRRKVWLVPQDLPCPLSPSQVIDLFKAMQLPPPESSSLN